MKVNKAEARLEVLRGAGIDINKWLQKAGDNHRNEQLTPSTLSESARVVFMQFMRHCCINDMSYGGTM